MDRRNLFWAFLCVLVGGTAALWLPWTGDDRKAVQAAETPRKAGAELVPASGSQQASLAALQALPAPAAGQDTAAALEDDLLDALPTLVAQYEEATRYPPGSQPIRPGELEKYQPNRSTDVSAPFPLPDIEQPVLLSLQLDKYQYFSGEPVAAALSVAQVPQGRSVSVVFRIRGLKGKEWHQQKGVSDEDALYTLLLEPELFDASGTPEELLVQAEVRVGGEKLLVAAPFRYEEAVARISGVSPSFVQGANLIIPVQLENVRPGYYFLAANLYSQSDNQPLIHLEAEGRLNGGKGQLALQAHIAALRATGNEGPYWLTDISLQRAAEVGESLDRPGQPVSERFGVEGFPFSDYVNESYEDPLAAERRAFMEQLGRL